MLQKGQVIKNYKELCGLMGWKYYTGGDSKRAQLKELGKLYIYHKQGNKFIIDDIISKDDKSKQDYEEWCKSRRSKYISMIPIALLSLFIKDEEEDKTSNGVRVYTKNELSIKIGMVNKNYSYASKYQLQYSKSFGRYL